jgi:hypothetical protein
VESVVGQGSTFTFTLPCAIGLPPERPEARPEDHEFVTK